ncbi:MAG: hypothetical protein KDF64_18200 [Geminicoccaceae bacterium]|nr:hypothetical protein [Geminicoccaceae bacterium]
MSKTVCGIHARHRGAVLAGLVLAAGLGLHPADPAFAQMMRHQGGMHGQQGEGMGRGMGMHMGMRGHHGGEHDEVNMPGLRGLDATPEESAELAVMFRNFELIQREVTELPDGIRTLTWSDDPEVMATLVSHVSGMINRVEEGRDPQIFIQSPTLDIFFERHDGIESDIEVTDEGIAVTQTSDDPEIVEALHTHAGEVSDMADRGMAAVHEMMMQRASQ